jgi:hypothetical protein
LEYVERFRAFHHKYRSKLSEAEFDDLMTLELVKVFADYRLSPLDRVRVIYGAGDVGCLVQQFEVKLKSH